MVFFIFSVVVASWLVQWYGFVVSGGVVDVFVVLGLWLVVFIDCGHGFATVGLGFVCYEFGFCSRWWGPWVATFGVDCVDGGLVL